MARKDVIRSVGRYGQDSLPHWQAFALNTIIRSWAMLRHAAIHRARPAMRTRVLSALVLLVPAAVAASPISPVGRWGGIADTVFQQVTTPKGLPNPITLSIEEDGSGFLWTGTGDGLARWDGYRFRVYRSDGRNPDSLRDNFVQTLHTDPSGRLWIGTQAGGLSRYDPINDNFVHYSNETGRSADITAIIDDGAGGLWIGGMGGLQHLDRDDIAGGHVPLTVSPGLPPGRVAALLEDRDGALWAGTTSGLYRRLKGEPAFHPIALGHAETGVWSITALLQDSAGSIWAGTKDQGVLVLEPDGSRPKRVLESGNQAPLLQTLNVDALVEARAGEIWAATAGYGIVSISSATMHTRHMRHDARLSTSLADDTVWGLHKDKSGAVWAATARGLSRTDPQQTGIFTVYGAADRPGGLSDSDVTSVVADKYGRVWAGFLHTGADLIDPVEGRVGQIRPGPVFPNAIVVGLAASPSGDVFAGTWRGLYRTDATGQNVTPIDLIGLSDAASLKLGQHDDTSQTAPKPSIATMGVAWDKLLINVQDSLYSLDLKSTDPVPAARLEKLADPLTDQRLRSFAAAPGGKIWIGTVNGLNLFDPKTHHVAPVQLGLGNVASDVVCLLADGQNRLWVGTAGNGIILMKYAADGQTTPVARMTTLNGLPNDNIDQLLEDRANHVWVSTDDGLAVIDAKSLQIRTLHEADGVAIPSYYANAGAITTAGELVFGGAGGMTIVRPDGMERRQYHAPLVVTDLVVGGKQLPAARYTTGGENRPPIVIKPDANSLTVEFASLDFQGIDRSSYSYKLDGQDPDFVAADSSRRAATYTDLPPGNFTLRLRSKLPAGEGGESTITIPVRVLPAWYQTTWFNIFTAFATLLTAALVVRLSTILLRRRQRELEQTIAQRTTQLRESNDLLVAAANTLRDLGTIGREITANLDVETVFAVFHRHVQTMLDAPLCAIYLIADEDNSLHRRFAMLDGRLLETDAEGLGDADVYASQAAWSRRETAVDGDDIVPQHGDLLLNPDLAAMQSLLCVPLIVTDHVIGVICVQSRLAHAYGENEKLILRTIGAYGAIALNNARTLAALGKVQAQLQHLAYSDGLTDLPNRRMYVERLSRLVSDSRKHDRCFALLLIDLDHFKQVNDNYGHDAGDALLVVAAARFKSALREHDFLTRLGGDEFAVLINGIGDELSAANACQRISSSFIEPVQWAGASIETTVTIGAAIYPFDGDTPEALYKAADIAMYDAKRSGRNNWRVARGTRLEVKGAD